MREIRRILKIFLRNTRVTNAFGWFDYEKVQRLPLYLKGYALQVFQQKTYVNYEDCEKRMKKAIVIQENLRKRNAQLFRNRFQGPHEPVQSYVLKLNKLAKRAFKELPENGISQLIQDQFWVGIHDYIRHSLATIECDDFNELVGKLG